MITSLLPAMWALILSRAALAMALRCSSGLKILVLDSSFFYESLLLVLKLLMLLLLEREAKFSSMWSFYMVICLLILRRLNFFLRSCAW